MKTKYILTVAVTILFLGSLLGGIVVFLNSKDSGGKTNSGSAIPSEIVNDFNEAQGKLSYPIKVPGETIRNEVPVKIEIGVKSEFIDDSDTIRIVYAENGQALYQLSETTQKRGEAQGLEVSINGITGFYYELFNEGATNNNAVTLENTLIPRSYITWTVDGVRYEISEFGELSKEDLIKIGESLQDFE